MIEIADFGALRARLGEEVAVSDWLEITQARISQFADATDDHQWIHVDEARAKADSPYHATIAHGFLTLSLVSRIVRSAMTLPKLRHAINYGVNKVRFIAAVPSGSRIRGRISPLAIDDVKDAVQVTWKVSIEREGADKPCCVAEWIVRYYP